MTKDDADLIEHTLNNALAAHRAAFDVRMKGLEGRIEIFAAVLGLVSIATDGPACKARILALQKQADQARDLQGKLAAEREAFAKRVAEHAAKVAADHAALDDRGRLLREARGEIGREAILQHKASLPQPHDRSGAPEFPAGSTITREPYRNEPVKDAHYS
jgi:hypothetical protein